jgi:hypothetical protein
MPPRWQPSLEDYIDIAAYLLGAVRAAVAALPRLSLAEPAGYAPSAVLDRRNFVAAAPTLPGVPSLSPPTGTTAPQQHVLAEVRTVLDGPLIDLCDSDIRYEVELEHATLLDAHGMDHLDLAQITADKRSVTQTIAADLHDRLGAAAIRFPSRLDANARVVVFEGRAASRS